MFQIKIETIIKMYKAIAGAQALQDVAGQNKNPNLDLSCAISTLNDLCGEIETNLDEIMEPKDE